MKSVFGLSDFSICWAWWVTMIKCLNTKLTNLYDKFGEKMACILFETAWCIGIKIHQCIGEYAYGSFNFDMACERVLNKWTEMKMCKPVLVLCTANCTQSTLVRREESKLWMDTVDHTRIYNVHIQKHKSPA